MLRNRSRAVTSKQALMADHSSQSPPIQNQTKKDPSFFGSSKFKAFTLKCFPEVEPAISPTSILDSTKLFSLSKNPFWYDKNPPKSPKNSSETKHSWDQLDSKGIGIALIDEEKSNEEHNASFSIPSNRMVLFGNKIRVQIPQVVNFTLSLSKSPKSPADFGIKSKNSQFSVSSSTNSGTQTKGFPQVLTGSLSMSEMELSEDYTCVISYGPNPRTTHIFDNCVLDNFYSSSDKSNSAPKNFLSFCYTCKKNLEQKNDIFIYRGEKAFCSRECRYQEMLIDEVEN
ncbi:hypothetical protein JCGZ_21905 [Jatropha curcas]|uniref:FLZ-type domain-containing protein n=1 Tax=Jatropha curcas TaxID=180498 RepID=A0A067JPG5_JATCU|nr:FCS-Like Zinc finger 8 [Jatropha curcas]KDP21434.1 hypothetical protein JCGZ_21905 [Jatropha curcas]